MKENVMYEDVVKTNRINFIKKCLKVLDIDTNKVIYEITGNYGEGILKGIYNLGDYYSSSFGMVRHVDTLPCILINWDKVSLFSLFQIIGHEAQHIIQTHNGVLKYSDPEFFWEGRSYQNFDYYDLPWEKDAFRMQGINATHIKNNLKINETALSMELNIFPRNCHDQIFDVTTQRGI